jgi:CO/xanthine dehydrogenase Mo-binding subunit
MEPSPEIASGSSRYESEVLLTKLRRQKMSPSNPLGVKGVGEAGTIGATPAIANAVVDALSPLGIRHLDLPFTPERVWRAIQDKGGRS